ncbi:unnamed protein product [Nesidiocoris tenuis]|uniref:Uncharacterized protein n=1 Tax=Nesidiocoris tenuis TaxID=355587 RepID=A0A6H5HT89_9HEMI|nr:unnamed protein product [Nesidiocoris tenuis]
MEIGKRKLLLNFILLSLKLLREPLDEIHGQSYQVKRRVRGRRKSGGASARHVDSAGKFRAALPLLSLDNPVITSYSKFDMGYIPTKTQFRWNIGREPTMETRRAAGTRAGRCRAGQSEPFDQLAARTNTAEVLTSRPARLSKPVSCCGNILWFEKCNTSEYAAGGHRPTRSDAAKHPYDDPLNPFEKRRIFVTKMAIRISRTNSDSKKDQRNYDEVPKGRAGSTTSTPCYMHL